MRKRAAEEPRGNQGRMPLAGAAAWYRGHALPDQRAGALAVLIQYIQYGLWPVEGVKEAMKQMPVYTTPSVCVRHAVPSKQEERMPINIDGKTYYSTHEAADVLGLTHDGLRNAITRKRITVLRRKDIRRNFIAEEDVERYREEHHGQHGWDERREPGYVPSLGRAEYMRAYRERKKRERAEREIQATRSTADKDGGKHYA